MSLEIEVKYLDADHHALRQRLASLGAASLGRWFESNTVFDDPARSLKAQKTLLRLRHASGRHVLTCKQAAKAPQPTLFKVFEEVETDVADPEALQAILARLGFAPVLRYEKLREQWRLSDCAVCLDTLPFGDFVEIEGSQEGIAACAQALDLSPDKASAATYHELNRLARQAQGLAPEDSFCFDPAEKARLLARPAAD